MTTIKTHNFLEEQKRLNPDFNISQWTNDKSRTDAERIAGEQYKKSLDFDGGNSDDGDVIKRIEQHLVNREYKEASDLAFEALASGDIRKQTYQSYKSTVIPNSQLLEGNVYFDDLYISGSFDAFDKVISSGKMGGSVTQAITVRAFMRKRLLAWLDENANNPKYEGNETLRQEDFNAQFDKQITLIKKTGKYDVLFGKGQFELTGKSSVKILEEQTDKVVEDVNTNNPTAQKIADGIQDLTRLTESQFLNKYGISRAKFKKENGL